MAEGVPGRLPPVDAGADTLARFRYQACLTAVFCLDMASGGEIRRVVPEYFEDCAVLHGSLWRFAQIKSRDASRRAWTLGELLQQGGAIRAMLRSFRALNGILGEWRLELHLEGPVRASDPLHALRPDQRRIEDVIEQVSSGLAIDVGECRNFLERVLVIPDQPSREDAERRLREQIGRMQPQLSFAEIGGIADDLIDLVMERMARQPSGDAWPGIVLAPERYGDAARLIELRKIDSPDLEPFAARLRARAARPLLARLVAAEGPVTALEAKLLAGGAPPDLVRSARSLQLNAVGREAEIHASARYSPEARLEDVRERLRQLAASLVASTTGSNPAPVIYDRAMQSLMQNAGQVDRDGLFDRDAFLLLGELCELSDMCDTAWGVTR